MLNDLGASAAEAFERLPDDNDITGAAYTSSHAISIVAPPAAVWR